ncbi:MAG: DUF1093 domain-containing protein [Oscillospiraceae bacterium]|jgi:uncharacterized protein YxeA|nr:DUF1093 domain-containing protein [Oscillospiraceae bacterium]
MKASKRVLLGVVCVAILSLTAVGVLWFKGYYDDRYALEDYYYTVVPPDYDNTPVRAFDKDGNAQGLKVVYTLVCYSADGKARELEFSGSLDFHDVYPPGTYIRVSASKKWATGKEALDASNVPEKALEKLREVFSPSKAASLTEYAAERAQILSARNTPSLTISCKADGTTLIYTYVYGGKMLAEEQKEFLDPVYKSQFRADKQIRPELTAIFLELRTEDGQTVFSQKYDKQVLFGYELNP